MSLHMLMTSVDLSWLRYENFLSVFFFFQAEDGIRDRDVTGVQTCALPISQQVEWGDVFLPAGLARLERGAVMANPEHRRLVLQDLLSELTDDLLHRSFLYQLLMKYKPDAVVDSINTATAFADQDPQQSAQDLPAP